MNDGGLADILCEGVVIKMPTHSLVRSPIKDFKYTGIENRSTIITILEFLKSISLF